MFEKEAEKWRNSLNYEIDNDTFNNIVIPCIEFGYNKANEWHYPSKGEYPKEYEDIFICFLREDDILDCGSGWYEYDFENDKHIFKYINVLGTQYLETVVAWKEIVLPELKESE